MTGRSASSRGPGGGALRMLSRRLLAPLLDRLDRIEDRLATMEQRQQRLQQAVGRVEARQARARAGAHLPDHEFQVFSQWGEDGIIQFLLDQVQPLSRTFVEFGVEDYSESNTRFLLMNDNWSGLVIDGSEENVQRIRQRREYWMYDLKAVHAFVTAENIDSILLANGLQGEIGLLSIDVDGNDYWIWRAITAVRPTIVVVEYNHRFGSMDAVTTPYDPGFQRTAAHHSLIYFGASLRALCDLAAEKGYAFVGCNSNGVNAFFVRRDRLPEHLAERSVEDGFRPGKFCETRDEHGRIVKRSPAEEVELLRRLHLPLVRPGERETDAR